MEWYSCFERRVYEFSRLLLKKFSFKEGSKAIIQKTATYLKNPASLKDLVAYLPNFQTVLHLTINNLYCVIHYFILRHHAGETLNKNKVETKTLLRSISFELHTRSRSKSKRHNNILLQEFRVKFIFSLNLVLFSLWHKL